jgi:hypothetical protein
MPANKNLATVKRIMISLVISLFVISLSVPVYAPARRIDYIEHLPVVPVADISMDYNPDVVIRSITGSGFGGFAEELRGKAIVIDCIGYGVVNITNSEVSVSALFVQQFSLNVVFADAVRIGEPLDVAGRSNLTIFTTEGRITFKGIIYGNATFTDVGPLDYVVELELSLRGNSSLGPLLSLQIHGTLTFFTDWNLSMTAEGQILARLGGGEDRGWF